jgi:hypothetical protein
MNSQMRHDRDAERVECLEHALCEAQHEAAKTWRRLEEERERVVRLAAELREIYRNCEAEAPEARDEEA